MEAVNGNASYLGTYFEISSYINSNREKGLINKTQEDSGTCGLWELAEEWTDEFEKLTKGRVWDGEFFDELEEFCKLKNKI